MLCWGLFERAWREHMSQANIKPVYYCSIPVDPIMVTHRDPRHLSGPNIKVRVVKWRNTSFPNTYHTIQIWKPILASYWLQRSTNLSEFWRLTLSHGTLCGYSLQRAHIVRQIRVRRWQRWNSTRRSVCTTRVDGWVTYVIPSVRSLSSISFSALVWVALPWRLRARTYSSSRYD